jgi:hypothetical protein
MLTRDGPGKMCQGKAQDGDECHQAATMSVSGRSFGAEHEELVTMSTAPKQVMTSVMTSATIVHPAFHAFHASTADSLFMGSSAPTASASPGKKPGSRPGTPYSALTFISDFLFTDIMNPGLCVAACVSICAYHSHSRADVCLPRATCVTQSNFSSSPRP